MTRDTSVHPVRSAFPIALAALRYPQTALQVMLDTAMDQVGASVARSFHITEHGVVVLATAGEIDIDIGTDAKPDEVQYVLALINACEGVVPPDWGHHDWHACSGRPMQNEGHALTVFSGPGSGPAIDVAEIRDELAIFVALAALSLENETLHQGLADARETRAILGATLRHDLRHPIQAITATAYLLGSDQHGIDNADRDELLQIMCGEAHRLNEMLDETFSASIEADEVPPKLRQIDIANLVSSVALVAQTARSSEVFVDVQPATLTTDPDRLGRALRNLVDNAIKYSPADKAVDVLGRVSDETYVIQVIDAGPGVPPGSVHRLFTPFFSDSSRIDSTGLGLVSVAKLVRSLGGRVTYTRSNQTVFEIRIPIDSSTKGS